jgi:DNA-binding LacI/PurR family transcriptional regulator
LQYACGGLYYQVVLDIARGIPKYQQIVHSVREEIATGQYTQGQRLPSESDLGRAFGASRITVNRALRELQFAGLIERRAGSGSYVRAIPSQGYTFGLLLPELGQTEIFDPIWRGMTQAQQTDHHTLLLSRSLDDSEAKAPPLCRHMIAKKVSGVFFAPLELTPGKDHINRSIAAEFQKAGIPMVLLDRDLVDYPERSGFDLVGIDNRRAGHVVTDHLLCSGCKRVIFVGRPGSAPTVDARIAGYREAILDSGLKFHSEFVCRIDPSDTDAVGQIMKKVRPDGVVCANDFTAGNLMKTFNKLNVSVADQVRMAGIDDVKYATLLPVPLTTIHQPCTAIGLAAVETMVQRLRNPDSPARDVLLNFRLVIRQSCGHSSGSANPVAAEGN